MKLVWKGAGLDGDNVDCRKGLGLEGLNPEPWDSWGEVGLACTAGLVGTTLGVVCLLGAGCDVELGLETGRFGLTGLGVGGGLLGLGVVCKRGAVV